MAAEAAMARGAWLVEGGRMRYADAWAFQRSLVAARQAGRIEDVVLLVEHPPVITIGRGGRAANILVSRDLLAAQGFDRPRPAGPVGAAHLRRVIRQLGLLQIDFVNVVTPAHYQVPFSRLGPYDPARLWITRLPPQVPQLARPVRRYFDSIPLAGRPQSWPCVARR